jgi:diadenosine tetraphosphatase ApaH/serine/threonine PP2A family protein phosphatase
MIFAIISDIHANLEALEACLTEINKIKPDRIVCLGDLVDYCAQPNEVVEIIKTSCDVVILGNHDEAQFNHRLADGFSENAYISSVHTRKIIDSKHIEYFKTLPYSYSEKSAGGLLFVHASPRNPEMYSYVLKTDSARLNFKSFDEKVCFIGHSHLPVIFEKKDDKISITEPGKLSPGSRYIINPGSVGQPRDGDPRLSFGLFDTEKFEFTLVRLEYDVKSASEKILKEGLPESLAMRLFRGI